jgi:hypothetical protein
MDSDDRVLDPQARRQLLMAEVLVEEKLDGANVVIWFDAGAPQVATRGGVGALDRGGQRGRLQAWAAQNADQLRAALGDDLALYGEWLLKRHTVPYDRLPSLLIGLDVLNRRAGAFLTIDERDAVLVRAGLPTPPALFRGVLGTIEHAEQRHGCSAHSDANAEGLVIRSLAAVEDGPRIAKLLAPGWRPVPGSSSSHLSENRVSAG